MVLHLPFLKGRPPKTSQDFHCPSKSFALPSNPPNQTKLLHQSPPTIPFTVSPSRPARGRLRLPGGRLATRRRGGRGAAESGAAEASGDIR